MFIKILRVAFGVSGIFFILSALYVLIFYAESFHPGTLLMLITGVLFTFLSLFYPHILRQQHFVMFGKILFFLSALYFFFLLCFFSALTYLGMKHLPPNPNESTVIVLGSRVSNGEPSLTLQYRLDQAVTYLLENPGANCIVSGGQGDSETETEASVMAAYLEKNGISSDRIFQEDQSLDTVQNITYSSQILKQNKLSENVVIATSSFHEMRSNILMRSEGFSNIYSLPSKTPPALISGYYFREILSMMKVVLILSL